MQTFAIDKSTDFTQMSKLEIIEMLTATGEKQQELFQRAREVRKEHNVNQVRLRGVIEVSSFCQKNCDYCGMRILNGDLNRYRMSAKEILSIVQDIKAANIPIVFLQSGQDPQADSVIEQVIPIIKHDFKLSVLLCLGERPKKVYQKFVSLGADSYILKFEAANPELHKKIIHGSFHKRIQCLYDQREVGMKIGTGNIVGLPEQTLDHLAEDIALIFKIKPDFASSSPFIPNQNTPLDKVAYGSVNLTLNTMAMYRIALKDALIPTVSALEKIQKHGQLMGLNAGANVITINFTPSERRSQFQIYSKKRFVVKLDHALGIIKEAGLEIYQPDN